MAGEKIVSRVLGQLTTTRYDDWLEGGPVAVPYFDGQPLEVTVTGYRPDKDPTFLSEADDALEAFLQLGSAQREAASELVMAYCQEVIDCIGDEEDWAGAAGRMTNTSEIWTLVQPRSLRLGRRSYQDKAVYLQISCNCDWDPEHGLQLVYRKGHQLVRVSPEDGHVTTADAYGDPDDQDPMLWAALSSD